MRTRAILLLLVLVAASRADASAPGAVLSLRPATENACVAVEVSTPAGAPLTGLRWLHNDGLQVFPRVVLLEGEPGVPPDLTNAALILRDLTGVSLSWGEVDLGGPVTSSTGTAYAVFYFPPGGLTTSLGEGGGPGLGIRTSSSATPFYLTGDGEHWVRFATTHELAVEPVRAQLKSAGVVRVLAELSEEVVAPRGDDVPRPRVTSLALPVPTPFNPRVTLKYALANPGEVRLQVYDLMGRRVRTLVSEPQPAGEHAVVWEGDDDGRQPVASGVYFARFSADGVRQSRRLVLVR